MQTQMDNQACPPLGPRLFWIGFIVATIIFWGFVTIQVERFIDSSRQALAEFAWAMPSANSR
jgi:hypothetical protein